MKYDDSVGRIVGVGALALGLTVAGCAGNVTPVGSPSGGAGLVPAGQSVDLVSPDRRHHHHHGYCAAVVATQNFNGQAIAKGSWILFTSVTQFPGNHGALRVDMKDSRIRFSDGVHNYKIDGPDTVLTLNGGDRVRLRFNSAKLFALGGWAMKAPINTGGSDFIDDMVWRVSRDLPGNLQNVTWSAKFYSRSDVQQMHWQWGGAVYTRLTNNYSRLAVKPLDDNHYPPYNSDHAGTPERYKGWLGQGATGGGGNNFTGVGGPTVNVTPCD